MRGQPQRRVDQVKGDAGDLQARDDTGLARAQPRGIAGAGGDHRAGGQIAIGAQILHQRGAHQRV